MKYFKQKSSFFKKVTNCRSRQYLCSYIEYIAASIDLCQPILTTNFVYIERKSISCISSITFLVACYATLQPALSVRPSVGPSVRRSVRHTLLFLGFCSFWLHCSCPNDLMTSITALAHPHTTGVAVYPALFFLLFFFLVQQF